MSEKQDPQISEQNTERYITDLPRQIDPQLATALGEMVVAYGRLENIVQGCNKEIGT